MTHVNGTANIKVLSVTTTQGNYLEAKGTAVFAGEELEVEAYGKTAEALAANQNSEITAQIKIFGGSNNPRLKIERIMSVAAPALEPTDERISQVRSALIKIKPKMTKKAIDASIQEAISILDN